MAAFIVFGEDAVVVPCVEYSAILRGFLNAHVVGVVEVAGCRALINGNQAVSGIVGIGVFAVVEDVAVGIVLVVIPFGST